MKPHIVFRVVWLPVMVRQVVSGDYPFFYLDQFTYQTYALNVYIDDLYFVDHPLQLTGPHRRSFLGSRPDVIVNLSTERLQ